MPKLPRFTVPSAPVLKTTPPLGEGWVHEIKFDGWRCQLYKNGKDAAVFSRNGKDLSQRFRRRLPSSAIIDGEIIIADSEGKPDFKGLMEGHTGMLVVWCFDLLAISGRDVRAKPLLERRGGNSAEAPRQG